MILDHFPSQAICRAVDIESVAVFLISLSQGSPAGDGLVLCRRIRGRILVLEDGEVVRADSVPDDVVGLRSVKLNQPQIRFFPMNSVPAFGITGDLGMRCLLLPGIPVGAPIVHPEQTIILKDRVVGGSIPLPRLLRPEHHLPRFRTMQLEPDVSPKLVDQVIVEQRFQPRANVNRTCGKARAPKQRDQKEDSKHSRFFSLPALNSTRN